MYIFFKSLTILSFILGLFLYLGGNETYFSRSGGTGVVILVIGTPLFAILAHLFKEKSMPQSVLEPSRSNKLFRNGLIMLGVGIFLYISAMADQDLGFGAIGLALIGVFTGLAGLITLFIGTLKN